jgi:GT2 family glycosyltransferase
VTAFDEAPRVGMACGKLWRGFGPQDGRHVLDSTGLFLNRQRRPRDRGQGELDHGQYDEQWEVFGACGAASMCRRSMLEAVACHGEMLDEDFFLYYDDADLSWRAQLYGWQCRYVPEATGWHERGGGDTLHRASNAPKLAFAQMHAIKNRYLMMWKNDTWSSLLPALPALLAGDLLRLAYTIVRQLCYCGHIARHGVCAGGHWRSDRSSSRADRWMRRACDGGFDDTGGSGRLRAGAQRAIGACIVVG